MIPRLVVSAVLLVVLLIASGARVVALWPQQPTAAPPPADELSQQIIVPEPDNAVVRTDSPELHPEPFYHQLQRVPDDYEAALVRGVLLFKEGYPDAAIAQIRKITEDVPRFELAHLILGDLLLSRVSPIDTMGSIALVDQDRLLRKNRLEELRSEARARLQGYLSLFNSHHIPQALIALGESVEHVLLIDKSKNRLYVYRNNAAGTPPELVDDFYIVLGQQVGDKKYEGDLKTPTGTYFVTGYLAPETLPPLYGSGAFPINYPNEYDRRLKKTGYGIWLHGTDRSLFSRPPLDSEGCVVLTNEEFVRIRKYIRTGQTPVIISEKMEWLSEELWFAQKQEMSTVLELWRERWERADLESYLQLYAENFWTSQHDRDSWRTYKKQVFAGKTFQQIDLRDLSLLGYPRSGEQEQVVVANFVQHYRSNNFTGEMRKRLYLVKEQEGWKVLYEGHQ